MKKKILLVVATHGDETIGIEAIKILANYNLEKYFDILIANPRAWKSNKRFIDIDLNRCYPGNKKSRLYEQKIAAENLACAMNYKYIIDIHEAKAGIDDFIIEPRENISTKFPLDFLNLKKVLLWPETNYFNSRRNLLGEKPSGPLSSILANAVELEFGVNNRNRKKAAAKAAKIIQNFICNIYNLKGVRITPDKKIYYVYGQLLVDDVGAKNVDFIDFKKITLTEESFYPLLTGQYLKDGIICYKMKKVK
ncbi:MAG: succinylglutamate desuccinylase/aspartoacylase family protein [Candidatus Buchananbacteria bacterium]